MKKHLLLLTTIITLTFSSTKAQNYYLNVPVYDTISSPNVINITPSPLLCVSGEIWFDTTFINKITGVNYYVKILSGSIPPNSLLELNSMDTLNLGDSILISNSNRVLQFGAYTNGGYFFYALLAVGTPTQLGDSFYCKSDISGSATIVSGCINYIWNGFHAGAMMNCVVTQSTNILSEPALANLSVFPNPFSNKLNLKNNNNELSEIILYDITSRKLLQEKVTNSVTLNTEQFAKGIYLYEVRYGNSLCKKGKLVKD
jgi:hypothetical protein